MQASDQRDRGWTQLFPDIVVGDIKVLAQRGRHVQQDTLRHGVPSPWPSPSGRGDVAGVVPALSVAMMRAINEPSYTKGYSRRVNRIPSTGERTSDSVFPPYGETIRPSNSSAWTLIQCSTVGINRPEVLALR